MELKLTVVNIQSFNKPLLARCGQLLEDHLKEVSESGLRLLPETLRKEYKELCKAGLFFHDVGKCEMSIQKALYENKKPPITHTHLSLIFFYSWLRDYLKKELYELLEESRIVRAICFGIISHHSSPHMRLDKNIFSQLFNKKITIVKEIFDILNKCGFLVKKDLFEQTYNSLIEGYKKNYYEFLFEYHLKDDARKHFVIFYNALVKADWYSAMGQKISIVQDLRSINLPRLVELERSKIHRWIYKVNKFKENIVLELPTGFGKTYLGFEYGLKTNRKRIIYTLPVTTIIEDVYNKFTEKLGKKYVEWYTSRYLVLKSLKEEISENEYLEAKYFDKPVMITTLDQILLAFLGIDRYPLRESAIYDSCIILDEPQLYSPLMLFLFSGFLRYYDKSEFNFAIMTATLPDFFRQKIEGFCKEPFSRDKEDIFKKFSRTFFDLKFFGQPIFSENGIERDIVKFLRGLISENKKISVIFNTVKRAQRFYKSLPKDFPKFLFHARFIYRDRIEKLQELKEKLKNPPIIVVSTQAIEAGIDVSFDIMFREIAPLDSLIQSAGRVNRYSENPQPSPVFIFGKAEDFLPYKKYQLEVTSQILSNLVIKNELAFYNSLQCYWERIKDYLIKDEQEAQKLIHFTRKISPFSINIEEKKIDLRETCFKVSVIPIKFFSDIMEKWEEYKKVGRKDYWQRKKILSEIESYMVEVPYFAKAGKRSFKDFIIWKDEDLEFPILDLKYDPILGVLGEEDISFRFV